MKYLLKKISVLIFVFTCCMGVNAQPGIQFTPPVPVTNSTYGYTRPKICLDANNEPVILWGKSSTHQIFVSTYNGSGFNAPVQINPAGTHPFIALWYNADIKSSGDTIIAVFATDMPAYHVYMVKSIDGGDSWSDTIRVDHIPAGGIAYFPSADINEDGNIAVTFMRHEAGWQNPRYVVTTSMDGGNSFSADTNASAIAVGEVCDCCPAHLIYENNRQVLLFRNNDNDTREFYAAVSNDNGSSFNGYNIDNQAWMLSICPSVAPTAFIDGDKLVSVFMSGASGANRIYLSTSDVNTLSLDNVAMVDATTPSGTIQNHPKISGQDSIMGLVWFNNYSGESDIYFRFSKYGADSLTGSGINISNPTAGAQQNPDIAYSNGVFHIVYQNGPTQELYYLKAIMDEYIGIEENTTIDYNLNIQNDILYLNFPGNYKYINRWVEICDVRGSVIYSGRFENENTFWHDLSGMANGIYCIRIEGVNTPIKFYR